MTSVSSVMGKAHRGDKIWYYLDDGLYGSYNGQLYDHVTYPVSTRWLAASCTTRCSPAPPATAWT
jgi:ornithine decarboxylase